MIRAWDGSTWSAMFTASNPPDPMHPSIAESLTGVAAETIVGIVVDQRNAGRYTEGSMATQPEVVSATADEVRGSCLASSGGRSLAGCCVDAAGRCIQTYGSR